MVSTRTMSNVSEGGDNPSSTAGQGSSKQCTVKQSRPSTEKAQDPPVPEKTELNLQYLPTEIFENIASYLPHRAIGQMRLVSRKMDSLCSGILNFKFQRLQTLMLSRFQSIKAKMPRRESARRNHPLACEADIIETLHMRLTLLQMTFGKHIERKHCCFFAGEILDECYRIIQYINVTQKLSRPYKVTDELFDLSTMAMEYFKEHIEPTLPEIAYFTTSDFLEFVPDRSPAPFTRPVCVYDEPSTPVAIPSKVIKRSESSCGHGGIALRNTLRCIKTGMKRHNNQLMIMRREIRNNKSKMLDQQKQILDYSKRLDENEKKNEENSRKFSTFLQELNKCKTELQYWRSKSPAVLPNCDACGKAFGVQNDVALLVNQGILPEGWPDVVHVAPVVAIINRDEVVGEVNMPLQNVVKKTEELKAGDSKQVVAKDAKVPAVKEVKAASCPKRKIEDEDVKVGISSSKPKEGKTMTGSKKIKLAAAAKEKASDFAPPQAEGSSGRRVLKPRVKQGKIVGKS